MDPVTLGRAPLASGASVVRGVRRLPGRHGAEFERNTEGVV